MRRVKSACSHSDLRPRSVHPANPAPLQRERELHSNKPNSAPRDATVAVERETGSRPQTHRVPEPEQPDRQTDGRRHSHTDGQRDSRSRNTHTHSAQSASRRLTANSTDMASASYHISNLLEKMTSSDKDFR